MATTTKNVKKNYTKLTDRIKERKNLMPSTKTFVLTLNMVHSSSQ